MLSSLALKTAAAVSPDGAKLNLLQRVRNLFKKIKEINDKINDVNEKDEQISQLLDAKEERGTKPNIDMFGPKTYLVSKEVDEPTTKSVSILNYLPQFKTSCLETIGSDKVDKKMKETIDYLSKSENKRIVALIATKINEKYSDTAGFTLLKVESIKEKCEDIQVIEDSDFHDKSDMLETTILNGPVIYSHYKEFDNVKKPASEEEEDLTKEMSSLTVAPNRKESGGKRKTKRKNKKSKKSSRKKRKTSKKKHLYKKRIQRGSGSILSTGRVYNHDFFYNRYMPGERLTINTHDKESHSGEIKYISENKLVIEESDGISTIPYDQIKYVKHEMYKK